MTQREIDTLEGVADNDKDEDAAKAAFQKLKEINPTYHYCYEWDGMLISDRDKEFEACLCFKS